MLYTWRRVFIRPVHVSSHPLRPGFSVRVHRNKNITIFTKVYCSEGSVQYVYDTRTSWRFTPKSSIVFAVTKLGRSSCVTSHSDNVFIFYFIFSLFTQRVPPFVVTPLCLSFYITPLAATPPYSPSTRIFFMSFNLYRNSLYFFCFSFVMIYVFSSYFLWYKVCL
jgi:hypothetical protein